MRKLLRMLCGEKIWRQLRHMLGVDKKQVKKLFDHDYERYIAYSCAFRNPSRENLLSEVIMAYHVVEKGLTMPNRRLAFGKDAVRRLMAYIDKFTEKFSAQEPQVKHGIGVLVAYQKLHKDVTFDFSEDAAYWDEIQSFLYRFDDVVPAIQPHMKREDFYKNKNKSFPAFAASRHTLRNYSSRPLPMERVHKAVELAMTTPSACNRQYWKTYCISNHNLGQKVLELQKGNRGFGHLADKVLIVTVNLEAVGPNERNDAFTNGGMYLMNLCYALFYYEIAHCVLNWSKAPEVDAELRLMVQIPDSESVVAILSCGETPEEFDVAVSPRRDLSDVLRVIE